jgi:sugar lactone lactonase YvrE
LVGLSAAVPSLAATLTVSLTTDSGGATGTPGDLRNAIATANTDGGGDTIVFTVTGLITLNCTTGTLAINQNMTISGPGAANLAVSGGNACTVFQVNSGVTATISGVTIENGSSSNGGGIANTGTLTVSDSILSLNSSSSVGGGIYNLAGALTLIDSTLSGNLSAQGGGIYNQATLTVTNSTLSGNRSSSGGGGIFNQGTLTVSNSTLSGNSDSTQGGGIYNQGGGMILKSTLLAGQTSGGNCASLGGTLSSDGYNLSDDTTCTFLTATGDQNDSATTVAGLSPSGLQNNGGPTPTIALVAGTSSAIDAIPVNECTGAFGNRVATDQRGVTRPQGKGCDSGAFEVAQPVPTANVCTGGSPSPCSTTITLNYYIPSGTTFGATPVTVVTQGATGKDFTLASTTCGSITVPGSCSVQVTFTPIAPGVRLGAVELNVSSGSPIPATPIYGIGVGPALAFTPGIINTVAGGGSGCGGQTDSVGDGCPASSASLLNPTGTALDSAGNLYIADIDNQRVRKVDTSGNITTVAGTGTMGYNGDNIPATSAQLSDPEAVAVDGAGNLYIADRFNYRVRKVDASGNITTVAGTGTAGYNGDNIPATTAQLTQPSGVAVDGVGNLYIADFAGQRIRKVDTSGNITTLAGNGTAGYIDNVAATSGELSNPSSVALDSAGNLYIADSYNCLIREVTAATGTITTVAGTTTGAGTSANCGSSGDGGAATGAELSSPYGVAVDSAGDIYIADFDNQRIRKVNGAGTINTVAGTGTAGSGGDGGPATSAGFFAPDAVTVDPAGNLYIADEGNDRIRKVNVTSSALSFPGTTTAGNTSSPLSVVVSDVGNANLNVGSSAFVFPTNFQSGTVSDPCGTTLLVGYDCNLGVEFAPTTPGNPLTGTLTASATNNAFDASQLMVSLSGVSQASTVSVTITSSPTGLTFSSSGTGCAPGTTYTTPQILIWTVGSSCTVAFTSPQAGTAGTRYVFSQWENSSTNASRSISAPSSTATYTATFGTQYLLATGVNPPAAGTVGVRPTAVGNYYASGTPVTLTATAAAGYVFSGWTGSISSASNPLIVTMNGPVSETANFTPALGMVPPSINFGPVTLWGGTSQIMVIINNTSATVKFTKISLTNLVNMTTKDLTYDGGCMTSIAPGKTCKVTLSLWPSKTGAASATLNLTDTATGSPQHVQILATIIAPKANVNSSSLSFGSEPVGNTTSAKTVTLSNPGLGSLTISSVTITGSDAADFLLNNNCVSPLGQGSSCPISVSFKPKSKGSRSATLKITDNAQSPTQTVSLSGTGH